MALFMLYAPDAKLNAMIDTADGVVMGLRMNSTVKGEVLRECIPDLLSSQMFFIKGTLP